MVILLLALLMIVALGAGYVVLLRGSPQGKGVIEQARLTGDCAWQHMMPLSEAARRYHRDKGRYPAHIEDVYPTYLVNKAALHCPADRRRPLPSTSYEYTAPDPAKPEQPILVCTQHGQLQTDVVARQWTDGAPSEWSPRFRPAP